MTTSAGRGNEPQHSGTPRPTEVETAQEFAERLLRYLTEMKAEADFELPLWVATNVLIVELARMRQQPIGKVIEQVR